MNIEKVVAFLFKAKSCQTMALVCFIIFNQPIKRLNREINICQFHLTVTNQRYIIKVMMYISRLIQILDRKCQFHIFDNYIGDA